MDLDPNVQTHCSLITSLSDCKSNLVTVKTLVESRLSIAIPSSNSFGNHKHITRINTTLKPDELQADGTLADFKVWRKGFGDYYSSNQMKDFPHREQRACLRGCLDVKVIQIMEQLLDVTDTMDFDTVLDLLQKHYEDPLSVMTRRVAFQRCLQKPGELFSDFFVRL